MKKGIIFDLDGTLLDSVDFWNHIGSNYLKYIGIVDASIDDETFNMTIEEASQYMKEKHNLEDSVSYIRMNINCMIEEYYFRKVGLTPGAFDYVEYLYAHGYKLIIATDTPKPLVIGALKRLGMVDFFVDVITTIKVKKSKEFPDIYDYCTLRLGLSKDSVLVFEDDNSAIKTLVNASYDCVGVGKKEFDTIFKIDSFKEEAAYKIFEKLI